MLPLLRELGIGFVPYSPLGHGVPAGREACLQVCARGGDQSHRVRGCARQRARAPVTTKQLHRRAHGRGEERHPGEREQRTDPTRHGRRWPWAARTIQCGILSEDRPLELLKLPPRLDPEVVDQLAASLLIALQRVGLPARSVQREHQLRLKALPQRMLAHERLELADQRGVPSKREVSVDSILERREALFLDPGSLALRERLVREVRQCWAPP